MKNLLTILFVIISLSTYGQSDFCAMCEKLKNSKGRDKIYGLKCFQKDTIVLNDTTYEIRETHKFKCENGVTVSHYYNNSPDPFFGIFISESKDTFYMVTDIAAEFTGGEKALMKYLNNKFSYPQEALENEIQGKVHVIFVVSKMGKIMDVKIQTGVHVSLDKEALRIVKNMPDWKPAQYKHKPVATKISIPINFYLD